MANAKQTTDFVTTEITAGILSICLDRPDKLNALTPQMLAAVTRTLRQSRSQNIRGIILSGQGRAFSAGHDLAADNQAQTRAEAVAAAEDFHNVTRACLATTVPTVAVLDGAAIGGAYEIALACDRRIGTPNTTIRLPENTLGLTITNASSYLLRRLVGPAACLDLVLAGRQLNAEQALQLGLVDEITHTSAMALAACRIREYNPRGAATAQHLQLLRPPRRAIETAMQNETEAVRGAWDAGVTQKGMGGFDNRDKAR